MSKPVLAWVPPEWKKKKKKEAIDKNKSFLSLLKDEYEKERDEISKTWKYKI